MSSTSPRGNARPQDGRGKGKRTKNGRCGGKNTGSCKTGPGKGQGKGKGKGTGRSK